MQGLQIAVYPREVFPAVFGRLYQELTSHGAQLVTCPEVNIEFARRFAARRGIAMLTSDAVPADERMARRLFVESSLHIDLCLLKPRDLHRSTVDAMWHVAERVAVQLGEPARAAR